MGLSTSTARCPLCDTTKGVKHKCEVCSRTHCRTCCKRYLALEAAPTDLVLCCDDCFLKNVAWDSSRTYDVLGPADGRPVVLVHGALIGRHCLILEARALADAGYRVILPDLPAHGSRFKDEPLTMDNAISTLTDVIMKEAPGQKVVVMGFSMGGYVAAAFAASHPELTAGVVMGACAHDTHTTTWYIVGNLAELVYKVCSPKTKSNFIYNSDPKLNDKTKPEIQECLLRTGAEVDAWKYAWRVMYDGDMRELLPKIRCPALVVVGEKDFRSHERLWLSLLSRGRLLVIEGGAHAFMYQTECVNEFRQEARQFAAAADWGKVGEVSAATPDPAAGLEADNEAKHGTEAQLLAERGAGAADVASVAPVVPGTTVASVSIFEPFRQLWQQRGSSKRD